MNEFINLWVHVCLYVCLYASLNVRMYIHTCICEYLKPHIDPLLQLILLCGLLVLLIQSITAEICFRVLKKCRMTVWILLSQHDMKSWLLQFTGVFPVESSNTTSTTTCSVSSKLFSLLVLLIQTIPAEICFRVIKKCRMTVWTVLSDHDMKSWSLQFTGVFSIESSNTTSTNTCSVSSKYQ